jgi:outer membrane protein assembly factor BamB
MKNKSILWILSLVLISSLLTGCTGQAAAATSWPGIMYDNGTIFMAYSSYVYSVNAADGTLLWKYPEKADAGRAYFSTPALTGDGQVIVADYKGTVDSLNATTGQQTWSYATSDRVIADILVVDQTIYVASSDYSIYALNLQGSLIWKYETGNHLWSKPLFHNGIIYQTSMDHKLYALSATDGKLLGSIDLGAASIANPVMDANGTLYLSTMNKEVLAVDPATYTIKWRYTTADFVWSGVSEKDGVLYFGDLSGNVVALDTATQKPVWQAKAGGSIVSPPLLLDAMIVVTSEDGMVNAFDYTGKTAFNPVSLGKQLYSPAVAGGDKILLGVHNDAEKVLVALDNTGYQSWAFQPSK